ncbi:MAG: YifB family Mg chelatase-like AAA ATPase [Devosiaceae bacterium]|nr:YifB family Mg chelatase-like AAA ATPase [Devosiaceae bacterium MH13]
MVSRVTTVAFQGVEAVPVDVQVHITPGLVGFSIVGLPDKAVAESRERVRSALVACGMALPAKRITINLAPADLPKEGSHFDLPIALGIMAAMNAISADAIAGHVVLGELSLDGQLAPVSGVLPAAMMAVSRGDGMICPHGSGAEAAWAGEELTILAARSLLDLTGHFAGRQVLARPRPQIRAGWSEGVADLHDVRGQESAKRALEIAAAGGHNLLMIGPPGSGKSMLAARLPGLLPPLGARELLDLSVVCSLAGTLEAGAISDRRPFRAPHHSASMAALVGGGIRARPGEISLAHHGVLFLDELPEFSPQVLDSLRQPLESGQCHIARANHHVTYPAAFQLVAAMNPCRCGHAGEPGHACSRGPRCASDYQARVSGPLMDRIDLRIEVPAVSARDLSNPAPRETSAQVAARVAAARDRQAQRYAVDGAAASGEGSASALGAPPLNARVSQASIERHCQLDAGAQALLSEAAERANLSARGYFRVLRVARTLADLAGADQVAREHLAEAMGYRGHDAGLAAAA